MTGKGDVRVDTKSVLLIKAIGIQRDHPFRQPPKTVLGVGTVDKLGPTVWRVGKQTRRRCPHALWWLMQGCGGQNGLRTTRN